MGPLLRRGSAYKTISASPHHGMEEWFIIQGFYHGMIHSAREHIDAAAGGSFFALSIEEARALIEKMTSRSYAYQLPYDLDHHKMVDACMTCEECREIGHMGINYPMTCQDVNFVRNSNNDFCLNIGFNSGWNKPNFPFDNSHQGGNGHNFNINEDSQRYHQRSGEDQ
jgi:hypothetical protein